MLKQWIKLKKVLPKEYSREKRRIGEMAVENIIENISWNALPEGGTVLIFDIVSNEKKHPVVINTGDATRQLEELQNGRRMRASFFHEDMEVAIWKEPKSKYRIECRREGAIHLDITVQGKEMEKIFLSYVML